MLATRTRRTVTAGGLEVRSNGDTVTLEGYASTFDQPYDMGWYEETVQRGAFTKTLSERPDVRFLINHDGLPLARTTSKTLDLSQDDGGLHCRAQLDGNDPDVLRLVPKVQRGDLDQMSFAFRVIRQEWNEDYSERFLTELSLADGDVSIVTYPANPNTSIGLRAKALLDQDPERLRATYAALVEEREGKTLSASTTKTLRAVLESLQTIDDASDEAIDTLDSLLGVNTPAEDGDDEPARTGSHPSIVRARVQLQLLGL